jgi:hypothetical protein
MLDFNHVMATPGADIQYFVNPITTTLREWKTWQKPRGVKWIYMLGVGGGGSGGSGAAVAGTGGSGAGGGSGSQTMVMIPAMFVPDTLYVQCGQGGLGPTTSAVSNVAGLPTYVAIEPGTANTANMTLLSANPGTNGTAAAAAISGGLAGNQANSATLAQMPLAGRGIYNFLAGQIGIGGSANTAPGTANTLPTTGLIVTGGAGGGGCNGATAFAGGGITGVGLGTGLDFFPTLAGGIAATGSTPAGAGGNYIARNFLMNYGGAGGGGATTTLGGIAGAGAPGAPGCGGGGGGGANSTNTTVKGGDGGSGFVYIISW